MQQFRIFECHQNPPSLLSHLSTLPALALPTGCLPPWPQDGSCSFAMACRQDILQRNMAHGWGLRCALDMEVGIGLLLKKLMEASVPD